MNWMNGMTGLWGMNRGLVLSWLAASRTLIVLLFLAYMANDAVGRYGNLCRLLGL